MSWLGNTYTYTGAGRYSLGGSVSADVVPLEDPFREAITEETILAEAIFDNWEGTTCQTIKDIRVFRESGEPGPAIDYDILKKMLDKIGKRLPEQVRRIFGALLHVRMRYHAGYEIYFSEQRIRNDLFAERKLLYARRHEMISQPEKYSQTGLDMNGLARTRNDRDCKQALERIRICDKGIVRCAHELVAAKVAAVPHIKQLIGGFNNASRRFYAAMQTRPNDGSSWTRTLKASTPQTAGVKRQRDEEMERVERRGMGIGEAKKKQKTIRV